MPGEAGPVPVPVPAPAPEPEEASPTPAAKPVLASTLLSNLLKQHHVHQQYRDSHRTGKGDGNETERVSSIRSGFDELDDYVLMGGVERGPVVGISGDVDGGGVAGGEGGVGRLVSLHLLATVLLSNPFAKASVIDTTGSFPVSLLANIVRLRTVSQVGQVGHEVEKPNIEQALDDRVQEILGRVAISRVFGIEGVWEVLSEISADCRTPIPARDLLNLAEKETEDSDLTSGQTTAVTQTARTKSSRLEVEVDGEKELEIVDSEAEEEGINLDDDLGEANISQMENTYASPSTGDPLPQKESPYIRSKPPESIGRTEVIIIDNMATPISELFSRRERSFAHTLLTTFSRTLHNLSQTHNILTLLLNTLISPNPSNHGQSSSSRLPTTPISVFAATTARPALGRLFSDLCALHLLVTAVPKTAKDAEVLYASPPDPDPDDEPQTPPQDSPAPRQEAQLEVQFAFVVEVLKDTVPDLDFWLELGLERGTYEHSRAVNSRKRKRKRNRTQRWAPFTISPDGLALQNAFGPGTAGESTSVSGQMRIGKQFPFGRRV